MGFLSSEEFLCGAGAMKKPTGPEQRVGSEVLEVVDSAQARIRAVQQQQQQHRQQRMAERSFI